MSCQNSIPKRNEVRTSWRKLVPDVVCPGAGFRVLTIGDYFVSGLYITSLHNKSYTNHSQIRENLSGAGITECGLAVHLDSYELG